MNVVNIDLNNIEPVYYVGYTGEANSTDIKIDITDFVGEKFAFAALVFKNGYNELTTLKLNKAEIENTENKYFIKVPVVYELTKTNRLKLVVAIYNQDKDKIIQISKSPILHFAFDDSLNPNDVLLDDDINDIYKELFELEQRFNAQINLASTAADSANTAAGNADNLVQDIKNKLEAGEFVGPQGPKGEQGLQGIPGKDAVTDSALSPDSNNAIANRAVAEVLDGGKLLGFEVISDYAGYCNFEEHSSKYAAGLTNGGYVVILVTDMVYKDDNIADESQLLLAQGTYILKGMDVILQGVGIKVIQELLDDLDTRYLSYDEWKTVYDLLWSSIQLISESHNKLQEDVENELAKKQDREEWTLLINDTLTQDIATGTKYGWSRDVNNNAYSAKELFAEIVFPSELSANLALQINGTDASAIMWGLLPAKTKKVHIHSKMLPDGCIETEYVYKLSADSEITSHKSLKGINGERRLTAFTKLSISSRPTSGSVALPSGTAIKIWAMK